MRTLKTEQACNTDTLTRALHAIDLNVLQFCSIDCEMIIMCAPQSFSIDCDHTITRRDQKNGQKATTTTTTTTTTSIYVNMNITTILPKSFVFSSHFASTSSLISMYKQRQQRHFEALSCGDNTQSKPSMTAVK